MKKSKLLIERLNKTGPGIEPCAAPKNSFVIVAISIICPCVSDPSDKSKSVLSFLSLLHMLPA